MCVYFHVKFEVSSIILTSFRQRGRGGGGSNFFKKNKPLKDPPRLVLNKIFLSFCGVIQYRAGRHHLNLGKDLYVA